MEIVAFAIVLVIVVVIALAGWQRLPIRTGQSRTESDPPPDDA